MMCMQLCMLFCWDYDEILQQLVCLCFMSSIILIQKKMSVEAKHAAEHSPENPFLVQLDHAWFKL